MGVEVAVGMGVLVGGAVAVGGGLVGGRVVGWGVADGRMRATSRVDVDEPAVSAGCERTVMQPVVARRVDKTAAIINFFIE